MKRPLNIGVVGLGYWGPNLARNFNALPDCNLKTVCDLSEERLSHIQSLYPDVIGESDYDRLLGDPDLDAIVIATAVKFHHPLAKASLLAGKHTFIEKPLAGSSEECEELVSLAQEKGLILMVGHTFLYSPAIRKIKEIVDSGDIGDIRYICARRLNLGLFQKDINVAWDLAPHDISIILHIMGERPQTINCQGSAHITPGIEDVTAMSLKFSNERSAIIHSSWLDPRKVREMTIVGSKRMVVYDDVAQQEKIKIFDARVERPPHYDTFAEFHYAYHHGDIYAPFIKQVEPLKTECQHFIDCINSGSVPITSGADGAEVVRILEASSESLAEGGAPIDYDANVVQPKLNGSSVGKHAGDETAKRQSLVSNSQIYAVRSQLIANNELANSQSPVAYFQTMDNRLISADVKLGENVKIFAFTNLYGCEVGDDSKIGTFVEIQKGAKIGKRCKISSHTFICEGVTIEDEVFIGHGVTFTNDIFPRATNEDGSSQSEADWKVVETIVEKGASIGSGATLLCGITIGAGSLVGAGSVVTKSVPPKSIVAGNPARVMKTLSQLQNSNCLVSDRQKSGSSGRLLEEQKLAICDPESSIVSPPLKSFKIRWVLGFILLGLYRLGSLPGKHFKGTYSRMSSVTMFLQDSVENQRQNQESETIGIHRQNAIKHRNGGSVPAVENSSEHETPINSELKWSVC